MSEHYGEQDVDPEYDYTVSQRFFRSLARIAAKVTHITQHGVDVIISVSWLDFTWRLCVHWIVRYWNHQFGH